VREILGSSVSRKVKVKAARELIHSIVKEKPFRRHLEAFRGKLTKGQLDKLDAESQEAIDKIKRNAFQPKKYFQRRGPHRRFHVLPQHGFATRYFPMDGRVFLELHRILWKDPKHPHPQAGEFEHKKDRDADFFARRGYWWSTVFDLTLLKGVHIPGVDIPGRAEQQKHFSFFMATDGVGCSFVCWRPKRQGDKKAYTPETVPITKGRTKDFIAIDPGKTDLVTGVRYKLEWWYDAQTGEWMPRLGGDRKSVFRVSSGEWRDKAYHNVARRRRFQLRLQAKANGIDIHGLQASIPSGKTMCPDEFLKHATQAVLVYPKLYEYYKQERVIRWKTYQREQKAMHELCMRVKGDPSLKKEDVVVAYGAGQFWMSPMVGMRSAPVKRFRQHLEKYVTLVLTSEMRTSRVCSNGCFWDQAGSAPEKDELIPMRAERSKSGKKGPPIYAVRRCQECGTIWHRDVNAARNIARMFWYLREHAGEMPPWSHRRPQQQQR
jgi:hypothetical protein